MRTANRKKLPHKFCSFKSCLCARPASSASTECIFSISDLQQYMQKIFMGVSFSGIQWSFAFGVRSLSRHNLMSYSCFQTKVFTKFVDTICTFFYTHSPFNLCHCTEYKPSALEVMTTEENKLNATKQQFIIAKISGYASHGSKTHSSLCPTNLQLQNQVVLIPRWIRAVEHRKCVAGLSNVQPDFQDWILLNYRRIENAHEVHKKTWYFCYV